ncbi:MAG: adenosylcobinamide-GDP ribazoletransferase, partial [Actinobacteria bacterium]|nr:adenosylcobinamide-GDP ribazoletransferase [Actinomycetota bacterium]
MLALKAICIAFSTYSIVPVPRFEWKEDAMRYSLGAFPLVGVLLGCALFLWFLVCIVLHCGNVLFATVATAIPFLVTGGIHMDGFCDT